MWKACDYTPRLMAQRRDRSVWFWVVVGLLAHTGWGAYPVFSRYLQTISRLPSLSLLAMGNLVVLLVVGVSVFPRLDKTLFQKRIMWGFAAIVMARAVTNLLAARFTLSIYVQLINQMTPFVVALMSLLVLRQTLPPFTGRAVGLCLLGAALMMGGDLGEMTAVSRQDLLGIGLAVTSTIFLAVYMLLVRRTATLDIPGEALLMMHVVALFVFALSASLLLGEDWQRWRQMETVDWVVFTGFSVGVLLFANFGQIRAIGALGAPMVSSMMAWRLVSALGFGALLLNERLTAWWQVLGAVVVLVTITWYLRRQGRGG